MVLIDGSDCEGRGVTVLACSELHGVGLVAANFTSDEAEGFIFLGM